MLCFLDLQTPYTSAYHRPTLVLYQDSIHPVFAVQAQPLPAYPIFAVQAYPGLNHFFVQHGCDHIVMG